jgi:hypothetical protein
VPVILAHDWRVSEFVVSVGLHIRSDVIGDVSLGDLGRARDPIAEILECVLITRVAEIAIDDIVDVSSLVQEQTILVDTILDGLQHFHVEVDMNPGLVVE